MRSTRPALLANLRAMADDEILRSARRKAEERRVTEMTGAEMDAFREWSKAKAEAHTDGVQRKQAQARREFTQKERDIFSFVRREFNKIADHDPDKHDGPVLAKAAGRFGVTAEEAKRIYIEVDGAGLGLD